MNSDFLYRSMQIADLADVHRLECELFLTPWSLKSYRFEIDSHQASDPWVACIQENVSVRIVGYIVPWVLVDEVHIANIAVDPDFRKRGIARQLLRGTLWRAIKLGVSSAILEVRASNWPARGLYRSFDFEIVGKSKGYYQDNGEDAIIMRLDGLKNTFPVSQLEAA